MSSCASCGRELGPDAFTCPACGVEEQPKSSARMPPKLPRVLDGRTATLMLVAFAGGQMVFAGIGAIVGWVFAFSQDALDFENGLTNTVDIVMVPTALVSVVGGGVTLFVLARRLFGR